MIAKAIDKILEFAKPTILNFGGDTYTDKGLARIDIELRAQPIEMRTLSSLVDYIKTMPEERKDSKYIVHIDTPTQVTLISALDYDRERETLAVVKAEIPQFPFNKKVEHEEFLIGVQSKFCDGDPLENDRALVLKFAGTVKSGSVTSYKDDGVSQKATVKMGVASLSEAAVPSPCRLAPYRTFTEVEQPISSFIFRLSEDEFKGVMCALYEADGGAWQKEAKDNISGYLHKELDGEPNILIIS